MQVGLGVDGRGRKRWLGWQGASVNKRRPRIAPRENINTLVPVVQAIGARAAPSPICPRPETRVVGGHRQSLAGRRHQYRVLSNIGVNEHAAPRGGFSGNIHLYPVSASSPAAPLIHHQHPIPRLHQSPPAANPRPHPTPSPHPIHRQTHPHSWTPSIGLATPNA